MTEKDYSKGLIYMIKCNDPDIKQVYIGSSCDFNKREMSHFRSVNESCHLGYNLKKSKFIRENGGWNNWTMIKLKDYPCNCDEELRMEEQKYIDEYNSIDKGLNHKNAYTSIEMRKEKHRQRY